MSILKKAAAPLAAVVIATAAVAVAVTGPKPGVFYSHCEYRNSAQDDPIVYPRQPGASHMHDFAGRPIDAYSEPSSLPDQPTTCDVLGDSAGYWFPALYVDGVKYNPDRIQARYSAGGKPVSTLQSFPAGLQVVAGTNAKYAKAGCRPGRSATAPLGCDKEGVLTVQFPDCWDGVNLRSPDGKNPTHMAYSARKSCPETHPVPVPSITMKSIFSDLPATGTVTLASGSLSTIHADFFNSWDQDQLDENVENCIRYPKKRGAPCVARTTELP